MVARNCSGAIPRPCKYRTTGGPDMLVLVFSTPLVMPAAKSPIRPAECIASPRMRRTVNRITIPAISRLNTSGSTSKSTASPIGMPMQDPSIRTPAILRSAECRRCVACTAPLNVESRFASNTVSLGPIRIARNGTMNSAKPKPDNAWMNAATAANTTIASANGHSTPAFIAEPPPTFFDIPASTLDNPPMEVANELMVRGIVVGVFQENCWVIGNRRTGEAICIDPGDQPEEILALARDMGVRIKYIANSHAHVDHILGVYGIHSATGAKFLLHEGDLDLLRNGWKGMAQRMGIQIPNGPPDPDAFVKDGDIVEVDGLRLRCIGTPGHTPGSVSYYADEGMLFSGDTLFRGSIGRTDLPGGSLEQEMASICDKLLILPDETMVLPGHMEETTVEFEKKHNPFVLEWQRRGTDQPGWLQQ